MNEDTQPITIIVPDASPAMMAMQQAAYALKLEQENKCLRQQLQNMESPPDRPHKRVIVAVMMTLLRLAGITTAIHDRSKMVRLISFVTGFSEKGIYKTMEEDKDFSDCHQSDVEQANHILSDLKIVQLLPTSN